MRILGKYINGNYGVTIFDNGTKIRENDKDNLTPSFAESCDFKITDCCDGGCAFCYEGCTPKGSHGDIMSLDFLGTLHPYTELAINGNDLSHPDLIPFLQKMRQNKIIVSMTVNQIHFEKKKDFIDELIKGKLIHGVGVSLREATDSFVRQITEYPNAVIHVINGILTKEEVNTLANNNLKILILGYKQLKRGENFYKENKEDIKSKQSWLYNNLKSIIEKFSVVSFDNLAIEQLNVKRIMPKEKWDEFFMGADGSCSFYIDGVQKKFAKNSLSQERYDLLYNIDDMFNIIRNEKKDIM